jgi:hypothetical protein
MRVPNPVTLDALRRAVGADPAKKRMMAAIDAVVALCGDDRAEIVAVPGGAIVTICAVSAHADDLLRLAGEAISRARIELAAQESN